MNAILFYGLASMPYVFMMVIHSEENMEHDILHYRGRYFHDMALDSTIDMYKTNCSNQFLCHEVCRRKIGCIASEFSNFRDPNCWLFNLTNVQKYIYTDYNGTSVIVNMERSCGSNSSVDGQWTDWTDVGNCSVPCGEGFALQTRLCEGRHCNGGHCIGSKYRNVSCLIEPCLSALYSWSTWSNCSVSCGGEGVKTRMLCISSESCLQEESESTSCSTPVCSYYSLITAGTYTDALGQCQTEDGVLGILDAPAFTRVNDRIADLGSHGEPIAFNCTLKIICLVCFQSIPTVTIRTGGQTPLFECKRANNVHHVLCEKESI